MSYDILVFDADHAPWERQAFLEWWEAQASWSEPHRYNDPAFTTPSLRTWFMEMIERFPALSGPYASSSDQRAADYCIGYFLIFVAISFDKNAAHERAFELARKHHLGLYEVSSPGGEIWLPGAGDELVLASKQDEHPDLQDLKPISDPRIAALVRSHSPGAAVVYVQAEAENPKRMVTVVYCGQIIEAITGAPLGHRSQRTLAELENALAEAGIAHAVIEQGEQQAFGRLLEDALTVARTSHTA